MKYTVIAALLATAVDAKYGKCTPGIEGKVFDNEKCEGEPLQVVHMSEADAKNTGFCINHMPEDYTKVSGAEEYDAQNYSVVIECDMDVGVRITKWDHTYCD